MKNSSTIRPLALCAAMLSAGLLSACGGGSAASDAVATTANGSPSGSASSETTVTKPGTPSTDLSPSPVLNSALSTSQYAESLSMTELSKATSAALTNVGSTIAPTGSVNSTMAILDDAPSVDFATAFLADAGSTGSVGTLAAVGASGRYLKFTDEGHSFTVPANSYLRFGDPVTNR